MSENSPATKAPPLRPHLFRKAAKIMDEAEVRISTCCFIIVEADGQKWSYATRHPEQEFFDQLYKADAEAMGAGPAYFGRWYREGLTLPQVREIRVMALLFAEQAAISFNETGKI